MRLAHGHARLLSIAGFTLTLACAAQHEESANTMPSRDAERSGDYDDQAMPAEAVAMEPASEDQAERSLDDIERELALNEAKLRALGVALPSEGEPSGAADPGGIEEDRAGADKRGDGSRPSGGGGGIESTKPSSTPAQQNPGTSSKSEQRDRKGKGKNKKPQKRDKDAAGRFAEPPPDEAKAIPLGPNESEREQDAVGRCEQVCVLSEITCELNAQICELAGRHPDEEDYESACERAAVDCEVAQEACNECVG